MTNYVDFLLLIKDNNIIWMWCKTQPVVADNLNHVIYDIKLRLYYELLIIYLCSELPALDGILYPFFAGNIE